MKQPRIYPPVWFLLFALSALALAQLRVFRIDLGPAAEPVACITAVLGGVLAAWARLMFLRADTTGHPFRDARRLLTHGAYRISRNPMYLGLLLVLCALVIWLQNLGAAMLPPLFVLLLNRCHILPEERRLARQFGDNYTHYRRRTRRWI